MSNDGLHSRSPLHEQTPLIVHHASIEDSALEQHEFLAQEQQFYAASGGAATVVETMTNLAKTCMGTGCLALPFAAKQGGVLLFFPGIIAIALWNVFASWRLSECWDLLARKEHGDGNFSLIEISRLPKPPRGTATLGKVAWYSFGGPTGLVILDTMTVLLLLGIIVAYNDAIRIFLQGTPFTTHSDVLDAVLIAMLIAPLSVVPDMGYLTKTSAAGLSVLGATLAVVAIYGLHHNIIEFSNIQWFPLGGLSGVSQWFGCTVFGFGIVPLTFNFRESMEEPAKLPRATFAALLLVAISYMVIGLGLLILYPDIEGDVLSELPDHGFVPILTRVAMVVVVMATAPLLIVPCAEILEGKMMNDENHEHEHKHDIHKRLQVAVRFGICFLTVGISVGIPEFVGVLTFVGCFCVAIVGFCIPPCLHLLIRRQQGETNFDHLWLDALFLAWGLVATGVSTAYVFRNSFAST